MNLNGIANSLTAVRPTQVEPRARTEPGAENAGAAAAQQAREPRQPARVDLRVPEQTLPAEPPAGTDPELWAVLSTEERAYFAKVGAMGPLTYGHLMNSGSSTTPNAAPAARGGRLDVRG